MKYDCYGCNYEGKERNHWCETCTTLQPTPDGGSAIVYSHWTPKPSESKIKMNKRQRSEIMERITEKTIGCFKYDLKDFEHKSKEFNDYDAFYAYNNAVKRLGEYEDTNLSPDEIEAYKKGIEIYKKQTSDFIETLTNIVDAQCFEEVRKLAYDMLDKFDC